MHRRLAEAPAPLMGPRLIVLVNLDIEIGLQLGMKRSTFLRNATSQTSLSTVLWKRSQIPLVCGLLVFVRE